MGCEEKRDKDNNKKRHFKNMEIAQNIPYEKITKLYNNIDWEKVRSDLEILGLELRGKELSVWKKGWEEWQARGPRHEGPYTPPPNPPPIIQTYREKMRQYSTAELVDMYFKYMAKIESINLCADKKLMYCSLSFSLLESLIKNCVESHGWFDIKKIPALEYAINKFIAQGIKGQILNIKDIVNYFPELKPWSIYLDRKLAETKTGRKEEMGISE